PAFSAPGTTVAIRQYNPLVPRTVAQDSVPVMVTALSWPTTDAPAPSTPLPTVPFPSDDVVELPLLLPEWQVFALEEAARDRGMTVGQLVRRLFADLFPRRV